jgi:hypothetical protein
MAANRHTFLGPARGPRTCPPVAARTGHNANMPTRGPQDWACPPVGGAVGERPERLLG